MRCILHIGTEKTGTTLIQDWLYSNELRLSQQGVFLSSTLGKNNNRKMVSFFQEELDDWCYSQGITSIEQKNKLLGDFKESFKSEITKVSSTHKAIVITSEHFHSRLDNPKLILDLKKYLDTLFSSVEIICYFREQSSMRKSLYSTALKAGYGTSLDKFHSNISAKDYYYNFFQIGTNWANAFGKENCHFRVYDQDLFMGGDIRKDFFKGLHLNIDLDKLNYSIKSSNSSLSYIQADLIREINTQHPYWNKNKEGVNTLNKELKKIILNTKSLKIGNLYSSNNEEIFSKFYESNTRFFNTFFGGDFLFKQPQIKKINNPSLSVESITDILVDYSNNLINFFINKSKKNLIDTDANLLRDVALKYESGKPITLQEAEKLMNLAHKARPNGLLIQQKLRHFRRKLSQNKSLS